MSPPDLIEEIAGERACSTSTAPCFEWMDCGLAMLTRGCSNSLLVPTKKVGSGPFETSWLAPDLYKFAVLILTFF